MARLSKIHADKVVINIGSLKESSSKRFKLLAEKLDIPMPTIRDEHAFFIAEMGSKLVGYVTALPMADGVNFMRVAVDPDFRRQGIGTKLVTALHEYLGGDRPIKTYVCEAQVDCQLFLRSMGYLCTESLQCEVPYQGWHGVYVFKAVTK